jgi:hypothetical protein
MKYRLLHFIECVDSKQPIDQNVIPYIHHASMILVLLSCNNTAGEDLVKNGYVFSKIKTRYDKKQFPPRVYYVNVFEREVFGCRFPLFLLCSSRMKNEDLLPFESLRHGLFRFG